MRRGLLPALLLAGQLLLGAPAQASGTTVAVGGALQDGTTEVWQRLAQLVQAAPAGRDCWHVVSIASAEPEESAARVIANLARHGARGLHLRVGPRFAGTDAGDARWADELRRCHGVFMTGGAQARLVDTLRPGGRPTPLLQAMWALWRDGGVVAGSSAGTAVLSATMFRDAPDPLAVMKGRLREGVEWEAGFGLLPDGVVIDQHAVRRGRIARLLPLVQLRGASLGVAVEENAAALFTAGGFEVLGGGGVLLVEPGRRVAHPGGAFGVEGATLHWLESGDRFELATRRVLASPSRLAGTLLQPLAPTHRGYRRGSWYYADMLGDGVIVTAMKRLVDGDQRQLQGLAFSGHPAGGPGIDPEDPDPDLAFEWTLRLDAGTRAWLVTSPEGYTVEGVKLDIVPVRLQRPLFRPLAPPGGR